MQMKTNKNGVKLLAAVMVLVMAFAGASLFVSDGSDAAVAEGDAVKIVDAAGTTETGYKTLKDAFVVAKNGETIVLLKDVVVDEKLTNNVTGASFTIDGQGKYSITLNKTSDESKGRVEVRIVSGQTLTFANLNIVNTDDNVKNGGGTVTDSVSIEFLFYQGNVKMENVNFTGDEKVEYAFTLNAAGVKGEFTNVDFNGKVVGTTAGKTNTMKVTKCQDLRINYMSGTNGDVYKLGTIAGGNTLEIDAESAATTTLNFAACAVNVVLTLDLSGDEYTFKNITERKFADYAGAYLQIVNGTLKDTTFGVYVGDKDDADSAKVERPSYIFFGKDASYHGVTLAGKTVIGVGTDATADYTKIAGEVTFKKGASIQLEEGSKISSLIVNSSDEKSNAEFAKIVAGTSKMTISDGSVIIAGSYVKDVENGAITITGEAKILSDLPNDAGIDITVEEDATLTIPEGVTVGTIKSNAGTLMIYGKVDKVSGGAGTVAVAPGVSAPIDDDENPVEVVSTGSLEDAFGMSKDLESDYTVVSKAFLENSLTIPEGITLTVKGTLDLNGHDLTVKGKLVIESKGTVVDVVGSTAGIILASTGTIDNAGIIGKDSVVTVKDQQEDSTASVEMKNVVGISFALTKEVSNGATYILTVSGEVSKKSSEYSLVITNAYVDDLIIKDLADAAAVALAPATPVELNNVKVVKNGQMTIGSKAVVKIVNELVLKNNVTLTIDGKITTGDVHMMNGSVVAINGIADAVDFCAKTGDYKTYNDANGSRYDVETSTFVPAADNKTIETKVTFNKINGITLEVTSKSITGADKKPWTTQMLNVYGTASYNKEVDTARPTGDITIDNKAAAGDADEDGSIIIPTGKELILGDDKMTLKSTYGATITTSGVLKVLNNDNIINESGSDEKIAFVGAFYTIEATTETGTKYDVYYYTTVDDAYSIIDTVDEKTIVVSGDFEFAKDYTVKAGQTIDTVSGSYTIKKGATVTVEAEGKLFNEFTAADSGTNTAAGIQGTLIVIDGATCTPNAGSYEVSSKDADNNRTYSGAATAIENATAGSTIYISNPVTFTEKTTIPADVTVDVASGATIKASKGLTVNGKILNDGTVDVTGALIVAGELENRGTVSVGGDDKAVTVTGKYIGLMAAGVTPNAAAYKDGTDIIYTTVQSAVAASSAMDVPETVTVTGKFTENADITLAEGMKLTIDGEIVLKSIRLASMSTLDVNGKLSADVIAAVGTVDTTGAISDAVINLNKVNVIEIKLVYSEATTTYTMTMSDYTAGSVTVTAGTVTVEGTVAGFALTSTKTLKVGEGATLVINKGNFAIDANDSSKKYLDNAGIISLKDSASITKATIGGEVIVALGKEIIISDSKITGTVTLETKTDKTPASVVIDGKVVVGSAPETLGAGASVSGKVNFNDANAYVVVFSGNTFASDVEGVKSTTYMINGTEFATIFAADGNDVKVNFIDPFVNDLDDLKDMAEIPWKSGTTSAGTAIIGKYATVSADVDYETVKILISAAPGMLVYIDDFQVTDEKELAIGQHTVTIYLQPNYEGTPAITFNGQKITDGKITITADMIGDKPTLVVTGATPAVTPAPTPITPVPTPSEKDDSMGITEYLLIVLVVLAAILVVVVAIRMMRS